MTKRYFRFILPLILFLLPATLNAQSFALKEDDLQDAKSVEFNKTVWKYRAGDDLNWANPQTDDSGWDNYEGTYIDPKNLPSSGWNGRGWFRLRLTIDESLVNKNLALITTQRGASEIYLDGKKIADFGSISDEKIVEYNPNKLPIPFKFETSGEHTLAVRFGSRVFEDFSSGRSTWLTNGGIYPGLAISISDAEDVNEVILNYAVGNSMRMGFLFVGILFALALLHFLFYVFYRDERANLFYSIYAASFGIFILANNIITFGHQSILTTVVLKAVASIAIATDFVALLAFLHVAFGRKFGKLYWILAGMWAVNVVINAIFLNKIGSFSLFTNALIGLTFSFSILILVNSLREKRPGSWILMSGVLILILGMTLTLFRNFGLINLPMDFFVLAELGIILGVPIAVSIFLARNFAGTNRDLKTHLAQVEMLSAQKIEQERAAAELRAENERRMKELEGARQLQLSMLPKKLPKIEGLEIAAFMKPATEVGGDYYDFHVGLDGTLTVAVGDATGHGLKAGSVVTATKSLFNAFAEQKEIPQILMQTSGALKKMNLRGLFMAMAMLKIKDGAMTLCVAGMPSVLIYRSESETVEEISIRAMPLGSFTKTVYREHEISLLSGDCVVLMSDGFPEMFNSANEILGFEKAAEVLPKLARFSSQEIINKLVKIGEDWAGTRPQDDDVTFVVLKIV